MFSHQEILSAELAHGLVRKSLAELRVLARGRCVVAAAARSLIHHRSALLRSIAA